jgi:drug/metabolite transporter (DMT)-like permease
MTDTQTVSRATAVFILFVAAVLEAGGDALVRYGLHAPALPARLALFALGGIVLFSYGYVVNAPGWDFGRLLGVYLVFFFLVAQAIAWLAFDQRPGRPVLVGGGLIVAGGTIIAIWPQ